MAERQDPNQDELECIIGQDSTPYRVKLRSPLKIGRGADNDLSLKHSGLSESHVQLDRDGDKYIVTDLYSREGTYLDGERLTPGKSHPWLPPDKALRLGDDCWFYLRLGNPPSELKKYVALQNVQLDRVEIEPGVTANLSLDIINQGPKPGSFRVSITGLPQDWFRWLEPAQADEPIDLKPGQIKQVKLAIKPPKSPKSQAESYPLHIQVESRDDPEQFDLKSTTLKITSFYDFDVALQPPHQLGVAQAQFDVKITNQGNTNLTIELAVHEATAQEAESQCSYEFDLNPIDVPAGEYRLVKLTAKTKGWLPEEVGRTHHFLVMASSTTTRWSQQAEGSWEQTPANFALNLEPEKLESAGKGCFTVEVSNKSEIALELAFTGQDVARICACDFDPKRILIPVDERQKTQLTIYPLKHRRRWWRRAHNFTVTARLTETDRISREARGEWVQGRDPIEWSVLLGILLLLALCGGTAFAGYKMFFPTPTPTPTTAIVAPPTKTPSSTPTSTKTPTPTPTFTATPTPTSTPTPTYTPSPSATPSPAPTPVPVGGIIHDFETPAFWARGSQPYGDFTRTTEQIHNSSYAGRLEYRFSNRGTNNDGANNNDYVVFKLLPEVALAGNPAEISVWVFGDGSCHYLNVWIRDNAGETWQFTLGRICHTGWQMLRASLDQNLPWPRDHIDGPGNGIVEYPIRFRALVLDDVPDTYTGNGKIYIDDLTSGAAINSATPVLTFPFRLAEQGNRAFQKTTNHVITIYVAIVNEKNTPLGGYKVIGDHTPSGNHVESELSEQGWTEYNCPNCGYIKQGNLKVELGGFEDGLWNIYLADPNGQQLSPVVPLPYSADPSQRVWDFVIFKRNGQ